jgi:hypothetical protein
MRFYLHSTFLTTAFVTCLISTGLFAQQSDSLVLSLSAYADAYYARFNDERGLNALQQYTTVSPRDNVIGLNIGAIGLHLKGENFRVNTVFHAGDIPAAIWSTDFPVVQAANAGIKLADGLWLDGGFFATHLGTESFLPKENLLSSTAVATYNEPFYQAFNPDYSSVDDFGRFRGQGAKVWWSMIDFGTC